jgi:hypothetical protein
MEGQLRFVGPSAKNFCYLTKIALRGCAARGPAVGEPAGSFARGGGRFARNRQDSADFFRDFSQNN